MIGFLAVLSLGLAGLGCSKNEQPDAPLFSESMRLTPVSQDLNEGDADYNAMVQDEIMASRENAITRAIADVSDAVTGISVERPPAYRYDPFWDLYFPTQERSSSMGSGFLISSDGYLLTNQHVVGDNGVITVTTTDGKKFEAKRIGLDKAYDVALLKIDGENFPFIPLGNSEDIIIGEWAIALGNPFGLFDISAKPTVTVGVISAVNMDFRGAFQGRSYQSMIQTDASINGGNSGGPLVNSYGQVIGINTFIYTGDARSQGSVGIGFAMPINRVKSILPTLKTIGHIDRSFRTGLEVRNISRLIARMKQISTRDGVVVTRVEKDSPSAAAGIEEGDIIVRIAAQRIRSARDAQAVINSINVTDETDLDIWIYRNGEVQKKVLKISPNQI